MANSIKSKTKNKYIKLPGDNQPKKLNIGCGWKKIPGFLNIDRAPQVKPDMVVNIEEGLPFSDNTFDYIYSSHCIEHVNPSKFRFVIEEIGRVAKHGCVLEFDLPFDNIAARTNFDHFKTFNFSSFDEITNEDSVRKYYYPFSLDRIKKKPAKIIRIIYNLFPFLINNVNLKFRVVKE